MNTLFYTQSWYPRITNNFPLQNIEDINYDESKLIKLISYDLIDEGNGVYTLKLPAVGSKKEDLDIHVENDTLTVSTAISPTKNNIKYLHKGIDSSGFINKFQLSPHTKVRRASLNDGILSLELEELAPERLKPKKIKIENLNEYTKK